MRGKLARPEPQNPEPQGFNEARALCAGSCTCASTSASSVSGCFNEARALCAGSFHLGHHELRGPGCFNEARALCAGSLQGLRDADGGLDASMRPAHYAREVRPKWPPARVPLCSFNEARALCAGSCRGRGQRPGAAAGASMRPAHYAREVHAAHIPSCRHSHPLQ